METLTTLGNAELVGTFVDGSPEWHAARADLIGASDVPIILGLSTYKSAYTLWHEKAGLIEPQPVSTEMQRKRDYGHFMEPFITDIFRKEHPDLDIRPTGTWRNRERKWQGCNPDRLVTSTRLPGVATLAQIKTANFLTDWEAKLPPAYVAQVQWELDTFGYDTGYLIVYFNVSGHYREYEIKADPFVADAVRDRVRAFADSIGECEPPDIDESPDTYETIRRLNPSLVRGKTVTVPEDIGLEYVRSLNLLRHAEGQYNMWRGHMLAHMGTAQYAEMPSGLRIASRVAKGNNPPYIAEVKEK
jgi:putative phage-type endonuclease